MLGVFSAFALVIGTSELYFRVKPWVFGPEPPVMVDVTKTTTARRPGPDGTMETWYWFDVDIRETCGSQLFERSLVDLRNDETKAPIVIKAPGSKAKYFESWLPVGLQRDVITVVQEEPGLHGKLVLTLAAAQCPSGYSDTKVVYQLPFDWTRPPGDGDEKRRPVRQIGDGP